MIRLFLFVFTLSVSAAALAEWVGAKAPAFALPDQTGKVRTLDEFRGRWLVLYFYPRDATPGCTQEAQQFRDRYAEFRRQGITVLGVSLDSVESHKRFAEAQKLPFSLLSDSGRDLSTRLDVLAGFGLANFTRRETFLIDPDGVIVTRYREVDTLRHAEQVLADVASLKKR